ncbi:FAD:protein FMN transferase [Kitasatospora sp. MAP5-34]|uniref:FAD:protein FMN transferase n=1 Tax=Kitasatospora sp. MAP5-34 TaxID=3035102 RepID=UPI0024742843|nr:FAD:protein FMN transferase [Kitasatospora sp. MAP5-34]MDH6578282.1 thiamine biosynthesis lipoprotein [Kitasatospora sp. MAP5-34]
MTTPLRHAEHVMGTVFSFTVRDPGPGTAAALRRAVERLHRIDRVFSTYRADSDISRLGRGELTLDRCDPEVAEVLERCRETAAETDGWFSERPGGELDPALDPSGWVKGWAIEESSRILRAAGSAQHSVGGGGDVQTCGGPWRIGIAHPLRPGALIAIVAGHDLAVATSGTAERGPHILDPHTGRPATALASLTLIGHHLARTDAWATAVFAMGPDRALRWAADRPEVEALAVLPDGTTRHTAGLPRHLAG